MACQWPQRRQSGGGTGKRNHQGATMPRSEALPPRYVRITVWTVVRSLVKRATPRRTELTN